MKDDLYKIAILIVLGVTIFFTGALYMEVMDSHLELHNRLSKIELIFNFDED